MCSIPEQRPHDLLALTNHASITRICTDAPIYNLLTPTLFCIRVQAVASGDAKSVVATLPEENNNVDAIVQANAVVNAAAAEYKDEQQRLLEKAEKQRALEEAHATEDARQPLAPRCLPSTVRLHRPFTTTVRPTARQSATRSRTPR
jgi:hypothetical protein